MDMSIGQKRLVSQLGVFEKPRILVMLYARNKKNYKQYNEWQKMKRFKKTFVDGL
jgi:hypothetical protein